MTKDDGKFPAEGDDSPFDPHEGGLDHLDEAQWLPEMLQQSDLLVPEELHSCFSDAPFEHCIECGCNLMESGITYVIQKARRNGETVLELAICMNCAQSMQDTMSVESRAVMEEFMDRLVPRTEEHEEGTCLCCGRDLDRSGDEYEIAGLALGPLLLSPVIMFCVQCHEELEESLSEETRRGGQAFIEKNFPGIPADLGLPVGLFGG